VLKYSLRLVHRKHRAPDSPTRPIPCSSKQQDVRSRLAHSTESLRKVSQSKDTSDRNLQPTYSVFKVEHPCLGRLLTPDGYGLNGFPTLHAGASASADWKKTSQPFRLCKVQIQPNLWQPVTDVARGNLEHTPAISRFSAPIKTNPRSKTVPAPQRFLTQVAFHHRAPLSRPTWYRGIPRTIHDIVRCGRAPLGTAFAPSP